MPSGTRYAVLAALCSLPTSALAAEPWPCPSSIVDKQAEDEISAVVPADDGGAFYIGSSGPSFDRAVARDMWILKVESDGRPTQERVLMTGPSQEVAGAVPLRQGGFTLAIGRSTGALPTSVQLMRFDRNGDPIAGQSVVLDNGGMWDQPRDLAVSMDGSRYAVVHDTASSENGRGEACITFVDSAFPVRVEPDENGIATSSATTGHFCTAASPHTDFRAVEAIGPGRWGVLGTVEESAAKNHKRLRYLVVDETAGIIRDTRIASKLGSEDAVDLVRLDDGTLVAVANAMNADSTRGWVAHIDPSGRVLSAQQVGPSTPTSKTKNDAWGLSAATATRDGGLVLGGTRTTRGAPPDTASRGWVVRLDRSMHEVVDSELNPTNDLSVTGVWVASDGRVRLAGRNKKQSSADHDGWSAVVAAGSGDVCQVLLR